MAHRVPFANPSRVIETLEKYGGAILTGFCDPSEVETVNQDVKPYLDAIKEEVIGSPKNTVMKELTLD